MSGGNAIIIKNARVHNLQEVSLSLPRGKFIVITGLSGSGKSSLAFDTLYAEGQRRYVESMSAYARQFLGKMTKPDVDYITGIPPSIVIEQKVNTRNPRSTVGTSTEIYDYIKLLYARIGITYSPVSGEQVKKHTVEDVILFLIQHCIGKKVLIAAPIQRYIRLYKEHVFEEMLKEGINRVEKKGEIYKIEELCNQKIIASADYRIIVDRIMVKNDSDSISRYTDSIRTAFAEGEGECVLLIEEGNKLKKKSFSNRFEADGMVFEEPSEIMFSFNNPLGACPRCEGYGRIMGIDEALVIPDKSLSLYQDAVVCWKGEKFSQWKTWFIEGMAKEFPIHKPYYQLSSEQKDLLWNGKGKVEGINDFFAYLEAKKYKIQYRVMLSRFRGYTICPECKGTRLRKEAGYVKVHGATLQELVNLPISQLYSFFTTIKLSEHERQIAARLMNEIISRIEFLINVGLSYLTLNRLSNTLSGGESQRINLATSLGSSLVGSLYILDEPSIGLHPRDNALLIKVLKQLRDVGNTVLVVEHDEEIIRAADEVIDMGPLAGRQGGQVVFQGSLDKLLTSKNSLTAGYLSGKEKIAVPTVRKKWISSIEVKGARHNNLKNISVKFPLNVLVAVTGVSGSGKSSLLIDIVYPALHRILLGSGMKCGDHAVLEGDINMLSFVECVSQEPMGRSSRSNPVTYIKAYDDIRKLFASQHTAKIQGLTAAHFSFNVPGGRCDECEGEGYITVEMQFMADVHLLCESCEGKKFKDFVLDVTYKGKNIYDVLDMTVDEAVQFFGAEKNKMPIEKKIVEKLQPLLDVGLGYVRLGQASSTLSGGESQRLKLAAFLSKGGEEKTGMFIFDEPTTGLHFHDIHKLLKSFNALLDRGHSIVVIEHNPEIIKSADWVIDLGPEGGEKGGYVVFEGTPEDIILCENSYTGSYLKKYIG